MGSKGLGFSTVLILRLGAWGLPTLKVLLILTVLAVAIFFSLGALAAGLGFGCLFVPDFGPGLVPLLGFESGFAVASGLKFSFRPDLQPAWGLREPIRD